MSDCPCREPTPPDEAIREALMTLPCEVITVAGMRDFRRFKYAYLGGDPNHEHIMWANLDGPYAKSKLEDDPIWKTLRADLDRTRFLAPQVLKEKMKMELTKY